MFTFEDNTCGTAKQQFSFEQPKYKSAANPLAGGLARMVDSGIEQERDVT
jgi:hypothetical protein